MVILCIAILLSLVTYYHLANAIVVICASACVEVAGGNARTVIFINIINNLIRNNICIIL